MKKFSLIKAQSKTFAVNGQKFNYWDILIFSASFDSKNDYSVKIRGWVATKDGCKLNNLDMDFH